MSKAAADSKPSWIKGALVFATLAAIGIALNLLPVQDWWDSFSEWLESIGPWAPLAFIAGYILLTIFLIPGSVLTIGAGLLFGVFWGTLWVVVGSNLGACLAFLIGRYTARGWVERKVGKSDRFRLLDDAVEEEGWKIVLLTRLSPVFPFVFLNYAFGLTRIPFRQYALCNVAGMFLGTLMWVYIGALPRLGLEGRGDPVKTAFWIIGGLATVAVTVVVTRMAKRALAERVMSDE